MILLIFIGFSWSFIGIVCARNVIICIYSVSYKWICTRWYKYATDCLSLNKFIPKFLLQMMDELVPTKEPPAVAAKPKPQSSAPPERTQMIRVLPHIPPSSTKPSEVLRNKPASPQLGRVLHETGGQKVIEEGQRSPPRSPKLTRPVVTEKWVKIKPWIAT